MSPKAVDDKINALLPEDDVLKEVRRICEAAGLPAIEVSAQQGKLLELLVRTTNSRSILEIGTLGSYSTICMARGAGPQGFVTTLEFEPRHVKIAKKNLQIADVASQVKVIQGDAHESLEALSHTGALFDFVFIDADKESNQAYFQWADKLGTENVTIVVDNVIRDGRILDPERRDKLAFIEFLGEHPGFYCTVVQTVGSKGWDGFVLAARIPNDTK